MRYHCIEYSETQMREAVNDKVGENMLAVRKSEIEPGMLEMSVITKEVETFVKKVASKRLQLLPVLLSR